MPVTSCGEQGAFDLVLALRIGFRLRPDVPQILGCAAELERDEVIERIAAPLLVRDEVRAKDADSELAPGVAVRWPHRARIATNADDGGIARADRAGRRRRVRQCPGHRQGCACRDRRETRSEHRQKELHADRLQNVFEGGITPDTLSAASTSRVVIVGTLIACSVRTERGLRAHLRTRFAPFETLNLRSFLRTLSRPARRKRPRTANSPDPPSDTLCRARYGVSDGSPRKTWRYERRRSLRHKTHRSVHVDLRARASRRGASWARAWRYAPRWFTGRHRPRVARRGAEAEARDMPVTDRDIPSPSTLSVRRRGYRDLRLS
jgi:hypothetical protein